MENKTSCKEAGDEELVILLRALRVEAVPEAHFEERFLYEFHERLAHEAVCRPARVLLWEHLLQMLSNFGRRRLLWSASSLSVGALCLSSLLWMQGGRRAHPAVASEYAVQSLMPSAASARAEDTVRTTVRPRAARKNYTERLLAVRAGEGAPYLNWAGANEDADRAGMHAQPTFDVAEYDTSMPDLLMHVAH